MGVCIYTICHAMCRCRRVSHPLSPVSFLPPSLPPLLPLRTADLLTAIEFDHTGDYLATGDRGGRVVLFEKGDDIKQVRVCVWWLVWFGLRCDWMGG